VRRTWLAVLLAAAACGGSPKPAVQEVDTRATPPAKPSDAGTHFVERRVDTGLPPGSNGPRTAEDMLGEAGRIVEGRPNVVLLVNSAVIRAHPIGARIGPLIRATTRWDEYMKAGPVDPISDLQWVLVAGSSLRAGFTDDNRYLAVHDIPEPQADSIIDAIGRAYAKGGPFKVKAANVKATLGEAEGVERVFLRPSARVLAIVHPSVALATAQVLEKVTVPAAVRPGEMMRAALERPWMTFPMLPRSIKSARIWMLPEPNGGARVFAEGDCEGIEEAAVAARALGESIQRANSLVVRLVTRGLLNDVQVKSDGRIVRMSIDASPEQMDALFNAWSLRAGMTSDPQP
jgi:hypothetical protein